MGCKLVTRNLYSPFVLIHIEIRNDFHNDKFLQGNTDKYAYTVGVGINHVLKY
ncbi:hypothetical protein Glaag_2074 [Glaciecola sp. 4H-3-7+YE-5]|jgi:hypothetical protein|nr:hypothetical protein Glaag_2074 [Glaciecola sp. 4H-3-7+YE-5]